MAELAENYLESNENTEKNKNDDKIDLLQVEITNENIALNVLIGFIGLAQSRGCYALNESSKIFEAIKIFQNNELY